MLVAVSAHEPTKGSGRGGRNGARLNKPRPKYRRPGRPSFDVAGRSRSPSSVPTLDLLGEAIEVCGIPLALMTDNGTPFVAIVRSMLSRFQRTLAELDIRHIRTQIDTPWTNGKIEAFWAILQAEVLDRQHLADLAAAEAAVIAYAIYYNYHRLHGQLGWHTPAERFEGAVFTDRGFEHVPALAGVADLLADLLATAA